MPWTAEEQQLFENHIAAYPFPATYFDFATNTEIQAPNMGVLENTIQTMLVSANAVDVRNGLANVVHWGNGQSGYRHYRRRRFLASVTGRHIQDFQELLTRTPIPMLQHIKILGLPVFSGISFMSKIIAFLDPANHCVLDLQLARIGNGPGNKALNALKCTTQISPTSRNQAAYDAWCGECVGISANYFRNRYRAVDVERGFFGMVQNGQLDLARRLYQSA